MDIIFLPGCFVALFFVLYWAIAYPREFMDAMIFQLHDGIPGFLVSVGVWIFISGATVAVIQLVYRI